MIGAIICKEWRQGLRDGRLKLGMGLLVALGLLSVVLGRLDYQKDLETAQQGNERARALWNGQEAKNPHGAAHYGVHVFKEPDAASLFDPGVGPYAGISVFLEAHRQNGVMNQPVRDRTSLARFGDLTPAFFLIHLTPLVVILLHFGIVARERASGMLAFVAASGISPRRWLWGKWLAVFFLPAGCLALTIAAAWIASAGKGVDPAIWSVIAFGLLLYLGSMVNVTLLVSARVKSPAAALLVLLGLWMIGSTAVPRLAADVAERLYPTPLVDVFKEKTGGAKKEALAARMSALEQETLQRYGAESLTDLPINYDALRMQVDEEVGDSINDAHYAQLYASQTNQNHVFRMFSVVWPLIPARFLSMGLARTDTAAHQHFTRETETFRREFIKYLNDNMMNHSKTGGWGYAAPTDTWSAAPEFKDQPRASSTVLHAALPDLGILFAWFAITGLVLFGYQANNVFRRAA